MKLHEIYWKDEGMSAKWYEDTELQSFSITCDEAYVSDDKGKMSVLIDEYYNRGHDIPVTPPVSLSGSEHLTHENPRRVVITHPETSSRQTSSVYMKHIGRLRL